MTITLIKLLIWSPGDAIVKMEIYTPPEKVPVWSWGAFIIPEFWFIWHEMWGADILIVMVETWFVVGVISHFSLIGALVTVIVVRLVAGYLGERLYFYRHGKFPGGKM